MRKNGFRLSVSLCLIAAAGYFFVYALIAIYHYGIHPLFADQWRIYTDYFNKPFPLNILASQNGHHPVIAGLFFLLDLKFFHGKQVFLLFVGTSLAVVTAIGLFWPVVKSRGISFFYKSASIYIVVSGMFWLANYRILLHANESVHAYLVTSFLLAAIAVLLKCKKCRLKLKANLWCIAACIFSQLAVFSFGAGVAVPPTLFILALLVRLPGGQLVVLAANMAVTALIYIVMPGASKVAGVLLASGQHLQKLINAFYLTGAPFAFLFSPPFSVEQTAPWIKEYFCPVIGGLGLSLLFVKVVSLIRQKEPVATIKYSSLGMAIFSALTIVLIAVMRDEFFSTYPQQVFAHRYLLWSNFFWISMGLILLNEIRVCSHKLLKKTGIVIMLISFTLIGFDIQHNNSKRMPVLESWHNSIQLAAASLVAGVHDDRIIEQRLRRRPPPEKVYALAEKLKVHKLNIFASPLSWNMGKNIGHIYNQANKFYRGAMTIDSTFYDKTNHTVVARISGWINRKNRKNINGVLIATINGTIVGYAVMQGHHYNHKNTGRLFFSGYIKDYTPEDGYRAFGIVEKDKEALCIRF